MSTDENKAIIRRLNEEFWNQGRAMVLDEVFAADFVTHHPFPGQLPDREGQKQTILAVRVALPDIQSTIEELIAEGDKVVWRCRVRDTHQAPFLPAP